MIGERNPVGDGATCLNCGLILSQLQQACGTRFCGDRCRFQHSTLAPHEVCVSCGRRLSPHQFGERLCENLVCRRQLEERTRESERLRLEVLRQEAERLLNREAEVLGVAQPDHYSLVIIPAVRRLLVPLDERRSRAFRETVSRLISEAAERLSHPPCAPASQQAVDQAVQASPSVTAVTGQACALCRGWCCANGGNHAYLKVETLHRYMIEHPEQRPHEVLANYLLHLGDETVEDSCIFHQVDGCALPREMRSDTCNRFYCPGLDEYRQVSSSQSPARGFFAATVGASIIAAAFCDENGARYVSGTTDMPPEPQPDVELIPAAAMTPTHG